MTKLTRRSVLRRSSLAGAAALAPLQEPNPPSDPPPAPRKLNIIVVGGHFDDAQSCAGGTMALFARQGHNVLALSLTGGPPPEPGTPLQTRRRVEAIKSAEILGARLVCLDYRGSDSGAGGGEIVHRSGSELSGERYQAFTKVLMNLEPDLVITHWPIDFHMDHRAASLLTYNAWLRADRAFPLYYMEAELGLQTQNFFPTHYVDISPVEALKRESCFANAETIDEWWSLHESMHAMRGRERGCTAAEAFNHHPQSPTTPALP